MKIQFFLSGYLQSLTSNNIKKRMWKTIIKKKNINFPHILIFTLSNYEKKIKNSDKLWLRMNLFNMNNLRYMKNL